jgi:hypothetical protein
MQIADCKIAVFQERNKLASPQIADCRVQAFNFRFRPLAGNCALPQTAESARKGADFRVQPFWGKPETCRRLQNPPGRVQISEYSFFAEICNLPQTAEFGRKGADFRVQLFCGNLKPAADYSGCRFQITAFRNGWQNTCNLFKTDYKFFRVQVFCQQIESAPLHCHLTPPILPR